MEPVSQTSDDILFAKILIILTTPAVLYAFWLFFRLNVPKTHIIM